MEVFEFAEWINIVGIRAEKHEWKYNGDNYVKNYTTQEMYEIWKTLIEKQ